MDFQNTEPQYEQPSAKRRLFVSVLVVAVAGIIFLGYIFRDRFLGDSETTDSKITGLEAALRTASFLDKTLLTDGGMAAGLSCPFGSNECQPFGVDLDQPHLGQAIYGYYNLSKATGDRSYRVKADRAMDFILDKCETNKQMCAWNFFPLSRYYFDTKEDRYLQGMLKTAQDFINMSNDDIIRQNIGHKLASLYIATLDERYRRRLLEVADERLATTPPAIIKPAYNILSIQVIWSLYLPAYNVTKNDKYLAASEQFFDNFDTVSRFSEFDSLQQVIKGVDALLSLAEVSEKGEVYRAQAVAVLQKIIDESWDTPYSPKVSSDYGFSDFEPDQSFIKLTLNNGWLVKLFIIVADEEFNLPQN